MKNYFLIPATAIGTLTIWESTKRVVRWWNTDQEAVDAIAREEKLAREANQLIVEKIQHQLDRIETLGEMNNQRGSEMYSEFAALVERTKRTGEDVSTVNTKVELLTSNINDVISRSKAIGGQILELKSEVRMMGVQTPTQVRHPQPAVVEPPE